MRAATPAPHLPRDRELLTVRELQVARLLVCGESHERIAGLLKISRRTVQLHAWHVARKLGARNACELGYKFALTEPVFDPQFIVREGKPDESLLRLLGGVG